MNNTVLFGVVIGVISGVTGALTNSVINVFAKRANENRIKIKKYNLTGDRPLNSSMESGEYLGRRYGAIIGRIIGEIIFYSKMLGLIKQKDW